MTSKVFPKPYIVLEYHGREWEITGEYETEETAEMHAMDVLENDNPIDVKIVKESDLSIKLRKLRE